MYDKSDITNQWGKNWNEWFSDSRLASKLKKEDPFIISSTTVISKLVKDTRKCVEWNRELIWKTLVGILIILILNQDTIKEGQYICVENIINEVKVKSDFIMYDRDLFS